MMIFVLHIKAQVEENVIKRLLASCFSLKSSEIASLESDTENVVVRYYINKSENLTEFNYGIVLNVSEALCLRNKIYNALQLALPFAELINDDVVINDHSVDPTRWILVGSSGEIYVADEQLIEDNDNSFVIDRKTMRKVTSEDAFAVLPSKEYVEMEEKNRPVYFNTSESWNKLLDRP